MEYYILLGVSPDASPADIKRAYKRLARRYHPGINPGDRAAQAMFERVSQAFETLSDPSLRRQYDAAGEGTAQSAVDRGAQSFAFAEFDFTVARRGQQASTFTELFADVLHPVPSLNERRPEHGSDLHVSVSIPFVAALHGVSRQVLVTRQVTCSGCGGSGYRAAVEGRCGHCQGAGQVRWARGHMVFAKPCAACGGAGRQTRVGCAVCAGQGRTVRSEAMDVPVPPGIADGGRFRLQGLGHAGRHGGEPGDLYVIVQVQPHPLFTRQGDDLLSELPVAVHEAVLGARVEVPTLSGTVRLRIPPGTQSGARLRVAGQGMPTLSGGRGDLLFDVRLVLPRNLDERSRELMREFGERHGADVRESWKQDVESHQESRT
jgi:molecular chaperone DnaJ